MARPTRPPRSIDTPQRATPPRSAPRSAGSRIAQRPLGVDPSAAIPAVFVKSMSWHPILYRKRVAKVDAGARAGDLVAVYEGEQLRGYGIYNPRSEIAVRMLRFEPALPDEAFWQGRLEGAVRLRRELLRLDEVTDAYRVVHAEGDGLSGIVVDRLGDVLSAEAFGVGMFQRGQALLDRLGPLCGTQHTLLRGSPQSESQEGFLAEPAASEGLPSQVTIQEYGTRFRVRFEGGHKTGFFCDQRENRQRLAGFCAGRTVLDLCCYTGGFAVQAKRLGGAAEVTGVDLDEEPLRLARENANLNQVRVNFVQADVFAYMRDMLRNGRQYDVVVLDPPKLIRNRAELEEGTRKHFDLNRLAMQLVKPGGLLLSCSCAGLLGEPEFLRLVYAAARQSGRAVAGEAEGSEEGAGVSGGGVVARPLQVLGKSGAGGDHPVAANCPETEYLKAVWVRLG
jgi:23S rRNA (cytosine1962-C5)-methyltransferase